MTTVSAPEYSFDHLVSMSTPLGTFERAEYAKPRLEHGFCTDDMARILVVACREQRPTVAVRELGELACQFIADAQDVAGKIRNRRSATGQWLDKPATEDAWGRSLWGLGTAARLAPREAIRQTALALFGHGAQARSRWPRAMAFAVLGAAEVLAVHPRHYPARGLLSSAAVALRRPVPDAAWPWPETRLTYANAVLAEALLVAGDLLARSELVEDGLLMLGWLLERETVDGHLSPTPVGGAGIGDPVHGFDQQPIEVAAMADACSRAAAVTGDNAWLRGVDLAARWFRGDNDRAAPMWDPATGGGYDGLEPSGPNLNQGAESTLALVSTLQHAHRLNLAAS